MASNPYTTGLQLQLDSRSLSLNDGDKVASWNDDSGQANHAAQATEANKPTYKTNIYGTKPAVRIVDSTDHIHGAFAAWGTHAGSTVLMCVANYPGTQTSSGRFFSMVATGGTDTSNHAIVSAGDKCELNLYQNGSLLISSANPGFLVGKSCGASMPFVIGYAATATKVDGILNGPWLYNLTHAVSLPGTPVKYSTGYINAGTPQGSFNCLQDIFFIAVYNTRLSPENIYAVSDWMLTELGLGTAGGTSSSRMVNVRGGADQ